MIDFVYGRGDVMLYPSAPEDYDTRWTSLSFSTTYMERGAHSGTDGKVESEPVDVLRPASEYDTRKTVPLVRENETQRLLSELTAPPPLRRLPVISLHHRRVLGGLATLAARGRAFVDVHVPKTAATAEQQSALKRAWLRPYDHDPSRGS